MPRPAKPYLWRGWFITNLGGRRHRLCKESEGIKVAREAMIRLRGEIEENGGRPFPGLTVTELVALFLDSVKVERSVHIYEDYRRWLTEFARRHGHRSARDITPLQALEFRNEIATGSWVRNRQSPRPYKPKTLNHALIALKRCWNWGIDNELIPPKNPFKRLPLLYAEGRQRVMTDAEFRSLLRFSSDAQFRLVLIALRYTSARPGEVRNLTWAQVDWDNHRWVIHRHKTSRTTRLPVPKIIPMCSVVENLMRWLQKRSGDQPYVFLNSLGRPWTRCAFVQRMDSLRRRAGIAPDENGENLVLYHDRHTFLTAAASNAGISGPLLQQLAGHTDPRMTQKYAHLADREIVRAGQRVAESLRPRRPGK
jgi:integrase